MKIEKIKYNRENDENDSFISILEFLEPMHIDIPVVSHYSPLVIQYTHSK